MLTPTKTIKATISLLASITSIYASTNPTTKEPTITPYVITLDDKNSIMETPTYLVNKVNPTAYQVAIDIKKLELLNENNKLLTDIDLQLQTLNANLKQKSN